MGDLVGLAELPLAYPRASHDATRPPLGKRTPPALDYAKQQEPHDKTPKGGHIHERAIRSQEWMDCMRMRARRSISVIVGIAVACMGASVASGQPHKKSATAKHRATIGAATRKAGAKGSRAKRSSRNSA